MAAAWISQLLDSGLITEAQVHASQPKGAETASSHIVRSLVAQGLDERALAGVFVSLGFGPMLQAPELARADIDLARRLPGRDAHELCALPLRWSPAGVVVAMADPTDEDAAARVAVALGGAILPTVARLSDLLEALTRMYPTKPSTLKPHRHRSSGHRHPSGVVPLVQERRVGEVERPREADDSVFPLDPVFAELSATPSPVWDRAWDRSTGGPPSGPPSDNEIDPSDAPQDIVEADLGMLSQAPTRDEVVRAGCEACLAGARGAAFLALRKGVFRGWDGCGDDVTSAGIRSLWVPAANPSVLNEVAHSGKAFRGPHGQTAADQLLRATLGGHGREILVVPVFIGSRMCGLLCATDPAASSTPIEGVAEAMGRAFQRLIVSKKADRSS